MSAEKPSQTKNFAPRFGADGASWKMSPSEPVVLESLSDDNSFPLPMLTRLIPPFITNHAQYATFSQDDYREITHGVRFIRTQVLRLR
jgi:hypothetical protein